MTAGARYFAVIPAAGRSRRMGRPKLTLPWRGTTVLESQLAAWQRAAVSRIVIVVRADDRELQALLLPWDLDVVSADNPAEMKDSIQRALQWIARHYAPGPADAWLLAPADLPDLPAAAIQRVRDAHDPQQPAIIVPVTAAGRRGHPVLFPWSWADRVSRLPPRQGVNALLSDGYRSVRVSDPGILRDLDTPADYEQSGEHPEASGPPEQPPP